MTRDETLLTLKHAARQLGLDPKTLCAHADAGKIACVWASDGSRLFPAEAVAAKRKRRYQADREARRAKKLKQG